VFLRQNPVQRFVDLVDPGQVQLAELPVPPQRPGMRTEQRRHSHRGPCHDEGADADQRQHDTGHYQVKRDPTDYHEISVGLRRPGRNGAITGTRPVFAVRR
jgi:hypothetical protein